MKKTIVIYRGPGSPERCTKAAELLETMEEKAAAKELHTNVPTLRKLAASAKTMAEHQVRLCSNGSKPLLLAEVTTPNGVLDAAIAAFKKHKRLLTRLEIPGWRIEVGSRSFSLEDLRKEYAASMSSRRAP